MHWCPVYVQLLVLMLLLLVHFPIADLHRWHTIHANKPSMIRFVSNPGFLLVLHDRRPYIRCIVEMLLPDQKLNLRKADILLSSERNGGKETENIVNGGMQQKVKDGDVDLEGAGQERK